MRRLVAPAVLAFGLTLAASSASAQDASPGVHEVHALERCVAEEQAHLTRIVRLMDEAETRTHSSDAAVAHDARESITALVQRAHDARARLEHCLRTTPIPVPAHDVVHEADPDEHEASLGHAGGTVPTVDENVAIASGVHVVRGERVDGRGTVAMDDLRRAVAGAGRALERCYDAYTDRASARQGRITVSFAAIDGAVREVSVENLGGFDAGMRTCVVQALQSMRVTHSAGRSVFSYELAFGG